MITTERLLLRLIRDSDASVVCRALSDPEVVRYYGVRYKTPEAAADQMRWFEDLVSTGTGMWWAICESPNTECIGAAGLNNIETLNGQAEIGFWLIPEYWGRGFGTEAAKGVLDYAFSILQLRRVVALVEPENLASVRSLERAGFDFEARRPGDEERDGKPVTLDVYVITAP